MNSIPTPDSKAHQTDRLLFVGILLLLIVAAVVTGRLIGARRHQARLIEHRLPDVRPTQFHLYDVRYGIRIDSPAAVNAAREKRAKYLAKAQTLRDHWQVWAIKHQDLLRRLKRAPPDDTSTIMGGYSALPSLSTMDKSGGVTLADVAIDQNDLLGERHLQFTWQVTPLKSHPSKQLRNDPNAQATSDRMDSAFLRKLQRDFAAYHSIMLSESMSDGYSRMTLWADGRITELVRHAKTSADEPDVEDGPEQELVPAYDFLK